MEDMLPHKYTHHCIHGETHRLNEEITDPEPIEKVQETSKVTLREKYLKNIKLFNKQLNKKQQDKQA